MTSSQDAPTAESRREPDARPRIGGYEIMDKIGRGGMGDVYRARQVCMDRIVALKVLRKSNAERSGHIERMKREAHWIGRLSHPNIIQGFDMGESDGFMYFAMEYVKGQTLHRLIQREGRLPERRAVSIALQIARAIGALWDEHIVHRDIKPGNIMVAPGGVAKLCDLGLAIDVRHEAETSLDEPGMAVGTPYYMSPEQVKNDEMPDLRSDIYSLGATLFRMLTGRAPFKGATRAIILSKHLVEPLPWPRRLNSALSNEVCLLAAKMMAKQPDQRYQTADQLVLDMEDFLAGRTPRIAPVSAPFWMPQAKFLGDDAAAQQARLAQLRHFAQLANECSAMAQGDRSCMRDLCDKLLEFTSDPPAAAQAKAGLMLLAAGDAAAAHRAFTRAAELSPKFHTLIGVAPKINCPEGMVYVSWAESSAQWTSPEQDDDTDMRGLRAVAPFYIDESPVTNKQYRIFVKVTGHDAPENWSDLKWSKEVGDMPVTHVSWQDAVAYAKWKGMRLPSEAEWELVAGGPMQTRYPWGGGFSVGRCNCRESGLSGPCAVGTFAGGRSRSGCYDMAGNVWEWTADDMPGEPGRKAVRGGSWQEPSDRVGTRSRTGRDPAKAYADCGFRCVRDITVADD